MKKTKKRGQVLFLGLFAIIFVAAMSGQANAGINGQSVDPVDYQSGMRSSATAGIVDNWNGNFNIEWQVSYDDISGFWSYEYTLFDGHPVWNLLLELPDTAASSDITNVMINGSAGTVTGSQIWTVSGSSTYDIYGIKFDGKADIAVYSFETEMAPVWGSFFATGGKNQNNKYAHNVGLDSPGSNNQLDFIVRPGNATMTPEPISSILFLTGGMLLAGRRYFGRNK